MANQAPPFEHPLLAALASFSTGRIYSLSSKPAVMEGLRLCQRQALRTIGWEADGSTLTVTLDSRPGSTVRLWEQDGDLGFSCSCGAASHCAHILCTLATLIKGVKPDALGNLPLSDNYLEAVRDRLFSGAQGKRQPAEPPGVPHAPPAAQQIILNQPAPGHALEVYIERDGHRVSPYARNLSPALKKLVTTPAWQSPPGSRLFELLSGHPEDCPVVFREARGETPLAPQTDRMRRGLLQLEGDEQEVVFRKVLDDGRALGPEWIQADDMLIGRRDKSLSFLEHWAGWALWDDIAQEVAENPFEAAEQGYFTLPRPAFQGLHGDRAELDPVLRTSAAGQPCAPQQGVPSYEMQLQISGNESESCRLVGVGRLGEQIFPLERCALTLFAAPLYDRLSLPLRAKKRRAVLRQVFLEALPQSSASARSKTIRQGLTHPDFLRRPVKSEAREVLMATLDLCHRPPSVLHYADGAWYWVERDIRRECLLLQIALEIFGSDIFHDSPEPGRLQLRKSLLLPQLGRLSETLAANGFSLVLDNRPLSSVSLDISLNAEDSGIDWFELRPEIRCGQDLLTLEQWQKAAESGLLDIGGELKLIDATSRQALDAISHMDKERSGEIIRVPRLHILDCIGLRRKGVRVHLAPEDERVIASLASMEGIPARQPPKLAFALRDYQRLGFEWLAFLYEHKFGACLADDMGLGKTIQAISLLAGLREGQVASRQPEDTPHLVIVPPSLLFNWESEVARFYPGLRTLVYRGQDRRADFSGVDLVLTSYELVRRDIRKLREIPFHVIIFDEAQAVKNISAATTGSVRQLKAEFKLALTGTPVENHLGEYFSIMDLALPGLLGDYKGFKKKLKESSAKDAERLAMVMERTRPFVLRRSKQAIASELPDKTEMDIHLDLNPEQKTLYQETVERVRGSVSEAYRNKTASQARIIALAALTKLRRICLDPRLAGGTTTEVPPKVAFLLQQLEKLRDEGHSVLVFSQFTSYLDLVEEALAEQGYPLFRLDGKTPVARRKKLVGDFQKSEAPSVFLLSLKAGGRGLNLTRASYVFHLDPWWNPAVENQASDRAHRIGQTRKVTIQRLLMRHTLEEKMMLLKEKKLKLYKALLDDAGGDTGAPLSREDFDFLLGAD